MSATDLVAEIQRLPREERLDVMGKALLSVSNEDLQALLRKRRVAALDALFAHFDASDHAGKKMTEEEIIALSLDDHE